MPQNPRLVYPALGPTNVPGPLRLDANNNVITAPVSTDDVLSSPTITTGTIVAGGTFQTGVAADTHRLPGGVIQNHGTGTLSVFFGLAGAGTTLKSVIVAAQPGQLLLSDVFLNAPYQGAISVDGTTGGLYTIILNSGTT